MPVMGEFECVRQQVFQNLLQSLRIHRERRRQVGIEIQHERESVRFRHVAEFTLNGVMDAAEG